MSHFASLFSSHTSMASRRLDISSLLCDDNQPPPFSPLDVLVAAATEERKRLDAGPVVAHSPSQPTPPQPQLPTTPIYDQHEHARRVPYPSQSHPIPARQLSQYEPDRRRHSQGTSSQDRAEQLEFQRRQQEIDRHNLMRAQELGRRHKEEEERRRLQQQQLLQQQEYERQLQLQQQREHELRARDERMRERDMFKREDERELERHQRELELRELDRQRAHDIERRDMERRVREQRERLPRENSERQRETTAAEQQRELNEYQRLEDVRRRQQILLEHPPRPAAFTPTTTHSPSISYLITHSPPTRKADHLHPLPSSSSILLDPPVIAIPSASHDDPRPIKKRRYSQSPTRPISDDKERIARERDKMSVGELGYGRVEPIAVAPSAPPRRPGSGNGHTRKPVAVSDLLVDRERAPQSSRSRSRDREAQQVLSPVGGKRSPPGSQIGRAKAARKSDDFLLREPPPLPIQHQVVHITPDSDTRKHKDDSRPKPEFKQPRHRPSSDAVRSPDESKPKKIATKEISLPPPPAPAPTSTKSHPPSSKQQPSRKQEDDAHEWFLQHFDEDPSPTISSRHEPPHTPSPSASPVTPNHPAPAVVQPAVKSPPSSHKTLTPITAAVSLEEELEELVSKPISVTTTFQPSSIKQQADDMDLDVDLAVTELVDTLDDGKHESPVMEVDVEDELLSLVDDHRPQPPAASSFNAAPAARRVAGPSAPITNSAPPPHESGSMTASAALSHHPHQPPSSAPAKPTTGSSKVDSAKQSPEIPRPPSPLPSMSSTPVISAASLNVSRHTSSRPTPERGSMPPPASTNIGAKKSSVERAGSVAPPATNTNASSAAPSATAPAKKKKETSGAKASSSKSKPGATGAAAAAASSTAPAKPRAKAAAKPKKVEATPVASTSTASATASKTLKPPVASKKGAASTSVSRSRSTSVMPNGARASVGPESDVKAEKPDDEADGADDSDGIPAEDDKLYCICKTKYDEDRFMIACDRCDEWYHTNCLHMSDLEVDLVDQFICPPCVEKNPHLHLRTTYKQRCLYGLRHPDPNSSKACHKAARGAFSKYCSDECGVKYMQSRVDNWAKKGGKPDKLWESVKGADKREGVVCAVESDGESSLLSEEEDEKPKAKPKVNGDAKHASPASCPNMDVDAPIKTETKGDQKPDIKEKKAHKQKQYLPHNIKTHLVPPTKSKVARETERLNGSLVQVLKSREELKRGMEIIVWRERLLQLATERAEMVDQCGWDQRLCMDDQEWEDSGAAAIESYEDLQAKAEATKEQSTSMEVDGAEEQWWCPGNKVCTRHQGWQTVRYKDIAKEKEKNEDALSKLTTREREIRKRIEDMLDPQKAATSPTTPAATSSKEETTSRPTLKATNKAAVNGHSKAKGAATSADAASKKGKKRKAPTA
ncbi:hypothetical protein D9619_003221 [Psilocybe cf. subviscida]|uniref:PHD-type domain-containing protein n=1 Tax=Psilocybe cf. subviscida TaxID=2480587 RepID=A0A8H5AVR6_9AGAR|nr:hypothetical protein D9619_003221 [Psilocybe cf. subviscida]